MGDNIKVSLIISTFNRDEVLVDTIKSVLKQNFNNFETLIIDQQPNHNTKTQKFLDNLNPPNIFYYRVTPPSLPAARNFGLEKARGKVIIYIDDDVYLDDGFIQSHWDSYKNKDVVAVAGRIKQADKPVSDKLHFLRKTSFGAGSFNYTKLGYVETAQGCNMSYTKKILTKVGGFDTNFIGNAVREESDVSFKIRKIGYKILFNPKACLYHRVFQTGGCREKSDIHGHFIVYRNEMLFFLRHRPKLFFPYFIGGHLYRFVFNEQSRLQKKVIKRLFMFIKGLSLGFFVFLVPKKQIVCRQLSNSHQ